MTWDTLFMLVFAWPVIFSLIFHIRPELERIHKLLAKKIKETNKKTHCKPKWHETHCLYSFSCHQSFFHCYFTCRTKIRKNILVISQKKNLTVRPNDARHVVCTHFHVAGRFFRCYFICRTKTRKNILVISQKKPKKQKKAHYVPKWHETCRLYSFSCCQSFFPLLFHM